MPDILYLKGIAKFSAPIRLVIFVGALAILWLPLAIPIYWLLSEDPNLASILAMVLLFVELLWFWQFWGKSVHNQPAIFTRYGLVKSNKHEYYNCNHR